MLRFCNWLITTGITLFALSSASLIAQTSSPTLDKKFRPQLEKYFYDTYESFDLMRGSTGLVGDLLILEGSEPSGRYTPTSATNIGFDILIQLEALRFSSLSERALTQIQNTLQVVAQLQTHADTGLFYGRYEVEPPYQVREQFVSAIDNLHLYIALYTVTQAAPPHLAQLTQPILNKMRMSEFFDPQTGMAHGGLEIRQGRWQKTLWMFRHFGSEGRSLFSLGQALGFAPPLPLDWWQNEMIFETRPANSQHAELMVMWDGGAFNCSSPAC